MSIFSCNSPIAPEEMKVPKHIKALNEESLELNKLQSFYNYAVHKYQDINVFERINYSEKKQFAEEFLEANKKYDTFSLKYIGGQGSIVLINATPIHE